MVSVALKHIIDGIFHVFSVNTNKFSHWPKRYFDPGPCILEHTQRDGSGILRMNRCALGCAFGV